MTRRALSILLLLPLFAAPLALASQAVDPPTGSPIVMLKLKNVDGNRQIVVGPSGVGVCKYESACGSSVTFRWIGSGKNGEQLVIEFTDTEAAQACFGKTSETITGTGPHDGKSFTASGECGEKTALFYTVKCTGGENGDCGGVPEVDPGVIIDGKRR